MIAASFVWICSQTTGTLRAGNFPARRSWAVASSLSDPVVSEPLVAWRVRLVTRGTSCTSADALAERLPLDKPVAPPRVASRSVLAI